MSIHSRTILALSAIFLGCASTAHAQDAFWSGDWYITLGGATFMAPEYEGDDDNSLQFSPIVSVGRQSRQGGFTSRNDSASFTLLNQDVVRAGITGKLIMPRDNDTSNDLKGLNEIKFGGEAGGFLDIYATDWLRARAEVRHGIRSHHGIVADFSADAFVDLTPDLRLSGGPRATLASNDYQDAFYKVSPSQSAASGISAYDPDGGLHSAGVGAALTWQATDRIELASFAEYKRLLGDAGDSSLVRERGSRDQLMFGISASYRFGVTLP